MSKVFLVSDTHFGHKGITQFLRADGVTKVRPWTDPDTMDEEMTDLWNETVGPNDKVIHLGDVVINRNRLPMLDKLHGKKKLVMGNHDIFKDNDYNKYFYRVHAIIKMGTVYLSHVPIHRGSIPRWCLGNIHGHLHERVVTMPVTLDTGEQVDIPDPLYLNVSVEHTGYKPILFEEAVERLKKQQAI